MVTKDVCKDVSLAEHLVRENSYTYVSFRLALRDPPFLRHSCWYPVDHTHSIKEANLRVWF